MLKSVSEGLLQVFGSLDADTVLEYLVLSKPYFAGKGELNIDLEGVTRSDSAGLALLAEWLRLAKLSGRKIQYLNPPAQMLAMAKLAELEAVLPIRVQS